MVFVMGEFFEIMIISNKVTLESDILRDQREQDNAQE